MTHPPIKLGFVDREAEASSSLSHRRWCKGRATDNPTDNIPRGSID
jgi:hypothetical protein